MTTLVRWNPRNRMRMINEFDRAFGDMINDMLDAPTTPAKWGLPLDVAETEDAYTVAAPIPGINPDDIDITLEDDVLTIKGETSSETNEENTRYHLRERRFGTFSRSLRFPVAVNSDAVAANYVNGVLTLTIPKAEEVKPKRIAISVGS
ncbi:MAG: Hsp20/alpha crystallin family protein [Anaerolinea sp.]|nr:Hsp20/alpha crystallin family protein [Anaerolinea sp.]